MFNIGLLISLLLVIVLIVFGIKQANALKTMLMGIEITLTGSITLIAFHLPTPYWFAPFILVVLGLICSFIGFYRKS